MRFIPIANARRIKIGQEVFTINKDGKHGVGKLKERVEKEDGNSVIFEVPQYHSKDQPPSLKPVLVSDITHVAFPVDRKADEGKEAEE